MINFFLSLFSIIIAMGITCVILVLCLYAYTSIKKEIRKLK